MGNISGMQREEPPYLKYSRYEESKWDIHDFKETPIILTKAYQNKIMGDIVYRKPSRNSPSSTHNKWVGEIEKIILSNKDFSKDCSDWVNVVNFIKDKRCLANTVHINSCFMKTSQFKQLVNAIKSNEHITALHIERIDLNDECINYLSTLLKTSCSLTDLSISESNICRSNIECIANAIIQSPCITTIGFSGNGIDNTCGDSLLKIISQKCNISSIDLSHNNIGGSIEHLFNFSSLSSLDISYNNIGLSDDYVSQLANIVKTNSSITNLNLEGNILKSSGVSKVISVIDESSPLKSLNLGDNGISVIGSIVISEMLERSNISHLNIENNYLIGDYGITYIINALMSNKKLISINIDGTNIKNQSMRNILSVLDVNNTLVEILLENNNISKELISNMNDILDKNKKLYIN